MGTKRRLRKEQWRVWDQLNKLDPSTPEYKTLAEQYKDLLQKEIELKKANSGVKEKVIAGCLGFLGLAAYRKMLDTSADPFFKDLGRDVRKIGHM